MVRCSAWLLSLACLSLSARSPLKDQPLLWKPTTEFTSLGLGPLNLLPFEGKKVGLLPFSDARPNAALIGENREDDDKVWPVTTRDSVAAFATTQSQQFLKLLGLPLVSGEGDVTVTGEVLQFMVNERNRYEGEVRLKLTVKAKDKVLWTGVAAGSTKRFGRSYKMDNYDECLCDAFLEAWATVARNPEFLKALTPAS